MAPEMRVRLTATGKVRFPFREAAVIVLAAVLAYLPALRGDFVFDDSILLIEQQLIHAADGLWRIWFTAEACDYYPVTWTVCWLQWQLWGPHPLGYHIVNILLHAVNAVLVFQVLKRLEIRGAWLAGLLFAVHPVNVAAVAWISEQKTTLAMLFFLATVLSFLRFERNQRWGWYFLSVGCYLLSLLAKPAAVMWPVVLLGLAWWRRRRLARADFARSLPFLLLSVVIAPVTVWFQAVRVLGGHVARTDGFPARLASAGWAVWFYLFKALIPVRLSMIYPKWEINPANVLVYLPGLLLVAGLVWCWSKHKTWGGDILAGCGYFVVMLFPVLGFFDQGFYRYSLVADHWQYLPIVGIIALVAGGAAKAVARSMEARRTAARALGTAVIIILGALTWVQSGVYFNNETLWRDTVAKNPNAWLAHYNLGVQLAAKGQFADAMASYEEAVRLKPDYADALGNLGVALAQQGRMEEAMARWRTALRYQPDHAETLNNLGTASARRGDFENAALYFSRVLKTQPNDADAHASLGMVYRSQGKVTQAIEQFQAALRCNPANESARRALAQLGASEQ
jgi:tetratricopeptide (TPR) repeat protein